MTAPPGRNQESQPPRGRPALRASGLRGLQGLGRVLHTWSCCQPLTLTALQSPQRHPSPAAAPLSTEQHCLYLALFALTIPDEVGDKNVNSTDHPQQSPCFINSPKCAQSIKERQQPTVEEQCFNTIKRDKFKRVKKRSATQTKREQQLRATGSISTAHPKSTIALVE